MPSGSTKTSPLAVESWGGGEEIGDTPCDTGAEVISLSAVGSAAVEIGGGVEIEEAAVPLLSSSMTMTLDADEFDDAATVDTAVVLSVGVCGEYIIFKSSRVGFVFNVVVRWFMHVSVRGEGERATNRWES